MEYSEAVRKINSRLEFGIKPGLERIKRLLECLGDPQKKLKFIHVAGTNGKGSTCNFISSVLVNCGYKTGMFISPFVVDFRERMQINGTMIDKKEFSNILDEIIPIVETLSADGTIVTEFELITAVAIKWFYDNKCDIVVLEVGLGGRFDSTNIIDDSLVSAITNISFDHTQILGDTIDKIAFEKAGIIKPYGTVVVYPQKYKKALTKIKSVAENMKANMILVNDNNIDILSTDIDKTVFLYNGEKYEISLLGKHQVKNAVTAINCLEQLNTMGFNLPIQSIKSGLKSVRVPARLEVLSKNPFIMLDGSHNSDGAFALKEALDIYVKNDIIAIIGILSDKDVDEYVYTLASKFSSVITVNIKNERSMDCNELKKKMEQICCDVVSETNLERAVILALQRAKKDNMSVVICGSLYLASQIRPLILRNI